MNAPFENPFKFRGKARARPRESPPYRRKILFEALEPRLLLSADVASPALADALAASLVPTQTQQQESAAPLQVTTPVLITSALDESAVADPTASSWIIDLADGTRALQASGDGDNVWRITGPDSGTLNGVAFSDVGTLLGGADNEDTFILEQGGRLSGYLDGGPGGFDTLQIDGGSYSDARFETTGPDSGTVFLDGNPIRYSGLEPVTDNSVSPFKTVSGTAGDDVITIDGGVDIADPITVNSGGTFENHTVSQPGQMLTVDAGDGADTINFDLLFFNTALFIDGGAGDDTIDVSSRAVGMSAIKFSDGSAALTDGVDYVLVRNIEHFTGFESVMTETGIPAWLEQGPGPINGGQVQLPPDNPVSASITAVAPHPFDANTAFIGSINGGIWRTTDGGSSWTPLSDQFPSLSIGDITISPLDASGDAVTAATPLNSLVVYAGTGKFSSYSGEGGYNVGVYKSSDGGATWRLLSPQTLAGLNITAIVPTTNKVGDQQVVLLSATSKFAADGVTVLRQGGIYRSTDGGENFARMVDGEATDLVADPGSPDRFYAGVKGQGVMMSSGSNGQNWTPFNNGLTLAADGFDNDAAGGVDDAAESATGAGRIMLAVQHNAANADNAVFAALISDDGTSQRLMGVFRATPAGGVWALAGSSGAPNTSAALSGNPNLTFAAGANPTITRAAGDWRTDGFMIGQQITVASSTSNNGDYVVTGVGAGTLTLAAGSAISAEGPANGITVSGTAIVPAAPTSVLPQVNLGGQGEIHFSILADATGNNVFVGGDVHEPDPFVGNLFLGTFSGGNWAWRSVVLAGANNTAPHADSRELAFDANNDVIEVDDGGIFRLATPLTGARTWSSINGNLRISEVLSAAYDPVSNIIFAGEQDDGSSAQQLAHLGGTPNLSFAHSTPDTITRSSGSWITDGFQPGQQIRVSGSAANDGLYTIASRTATVITLIADNSLTAAAAAGGIRVDQVMPAPLDANGDFIPDDQASRFAWAIITAPYQASLGWSDSSFLGDGNTQLAVPINTDGDPEPEQTLRFTMGNNFDSFVARLFDANGVDITPAATHPAPNVYLNAAGNPLYDYHNVNSGRGYIMPEGTVGLRSAAGARVMSGLQALDRESVDRAEFRTIPYVANAVNDSKMLIGLFNLYESGDRLETIANILPTTLGVPGPNAPMPNVYTYSALAYGGFKGATPVDDVIYAAKGNQVFVRVHNAASPTTLTSFTVRGAGEITDIVLDPEDWETAYVTDGNKVYKVTNHGADPANDIHVVSDRLGLTGLRSLEIVKTAGGDKALLVGTPLGVYRALNPAPGVAWTEFGRGLPNTIVADIDFWNGLGGGNDVLLAGTQGRGAWTLVSNDLNTIVGQESVLVIEGTDANDEILIQRRPTNAAIVDVFINSPVSPTFSLPISSFDRIEVQGMGGDDSLEVDSSSGAITAPGGIVFDGGSGTNTLTLSGGKVTTIETDTVGPQTVLTIHDRASHADEIVKYENVASYVNNLPQATAAEIIGDAFVNVFPWLDQIADPGQGAESEMAVIGGSLPRALAGTEVSPIAPLGDAVEQGGLEPGAVAGNGNGVEGLRRLIETGTGGFSIDDIGSGALATYEGVRAALDGLDSTDGNVTFTDTLTGDPVGGEVRFTAQVLKRLGGEADLDLDFDLLGGHVNLQGLIGIDAAVELNLVFGVDANGFFIDTTGGTPELQVRDLQLDGQAEASGRFGFLDVEARTTVLDVDDSVGLNVDLLDPGGDGKLRLSDLGFSLGDKVDLSVTGNPSADDVVLGLEAHASAILPGIDAIDLGNAQISLTWADVSQPTSVSVAATAGLGQDLIDFLSVDVQSVLDQISQLGQLSVALNGVDIPLLQGTLSGLADAANFISEKIIDPLTDGVSGQASFGSLQDMISRLASSLGVDPGALGLDFDSATNELTWRLDLSKTIAASDTIDLGFDLAEGLADLNFSSDASVSGIFDLGLTAGLDLDALGTGDPLQWFFIKDASASASLLAEASNVDASARFGFLSVEVVDGSLSANATLSLSLNDPNASDGYITIQELLDGLGSLGTFLQASVSGTATVSLPLSIPFLGVTPSTDTTLTLDWSDISDPSTISVQLPPDLLHLPDFTHMDAGTFVSLLGQIANWLDSFRQGFSGTDIPFVGDALDQVLKFADLFQNTLLYDDGGDGIDGSDKLIADINAALNSAGLGDKIAAEAKDGKVSLFAIGSGVNAFTVSGSGLGFGTVRSAATNLGRLELDGTIDAPTDGVLAGDITFNIAINGAAAVMVTVTAASTSSNTGLGNDKRKLLDANNRPTFITVQDLALQLVHIVGLDIVDYDPVAQELTLDLSLGDPASTDNLGSVDLPVNFDLLDLAPIASLSSDSTIRLSAGGGLTLTLGVYLGDEGAIALSDSTDLSTLKNGITFSDLQSIAAPNDVRTVYGQLSADASFDVSVNGAGAVGVTVAKADTDANLTVDDLVVDLNAALGTAGLTGQVSAERIAGSNKIALVAGAGVTSMSLTIAGGNPAITQMGLRSGTSATPDAADGNKLKIKAAAEVSGFVGRLTDDAVFQMSLSSVNGGSPVAVVVHKADTDPNRNILDVVADVQRAVNAAGFTDKVKVSSLGMGLQFATLEPGASGFAISAVGGSVAVNELGLPTSATGSSADLLITTRDGVQHGIVLDGATTLGDVVSAIETQTSNHVTVEYSDNDTRLKLFDHTSGGAHFKVENAPGTKGTVDTRDVDGDGNTSEILYGPNTAAIDLGIYGEIVPSDDPSAPIPLDQLEGGQLGGVDPLERLFVRNAQAAATLSVSTPQLDSSGQVADTDSDGSTEDGLNASARFGFVGIDASGGGHLTGTVNVGLKRPEDSAFDPNAKITLKDLVNHVSELDQFIDGPNIGGDAQFDLEVSLAPAFPAIGTGAHPMLHITVNDLNGLITDSAHASNYYTITTEGFDQLANFDSIGFGDIVVALRALADFLGQFEQFGFLHEKIPLINVSVDDLLSFADEFSAALDQVESNPSGTVQFLETKLKEAFGLPPSSNLLSLDLVNDGTAHILRIGINFSPEFSASLPIDLTLPVDTGPIDLSGAADLHAEGKLAMTLDLGIDLTDPSQIWVFGDTGIKGGLGDPGDNVALELSAEDIAFTAALGPIGARIVGGHATADVAFNLGIKDAVLTGTGDDRRILLTTLVGSLGDNIDASLSGSISGALPVYFPTESIYRGDISFGGTLSLTPEDGLNVQGNVGPGGTDFVNVPDEIFSLDFSNFRPLDSLLLIIDGVDGFLGLLQDTFSGQIGGLSLPLIGDQLADAANVIGDFRKDFIDGLRHSVETAASPDENYISQQLFHLLNDQLHILGDRNHDGLHTIDDIGLITNLDEEGVDWHDLSMEWFIELGGTLLDAGTGIDFDIGIPGLGLETRGAVNATIDWQLDFGFGVDMQQGFFIDVSDTNELELNVDVTLPGAGLTGRLAFLQLEADDKGDTHLGATFGVDVKNRVHPSETKLGFANLGDIGIDVGIAAEAVVDLGLQLKLNSDLVGEDASKVFPKIVGDFFLDWHIGDRAAGTLVPLTDIGNAIQEGLHLVEFRDVGVDLGSFISDFLGPVVHQIQEITQPIQPLVDVLTAPIPVISDLAGKPITLIDIAGMTGYVQPDLIYAIADVITLVNSIPDPSEVGSLIIPFGDFVVYDSEGGSGYQPALWDAGFNSSQDIDVASRTPSFDFSSALSGLDTGGDAHSETTKSFSNGFAGHDFGDFISFPVFQDPSQIFGLLMGRDATLIAVDLPPLDFKFTYSQYFPIFGPLGASITGTLGATIDFGPFGYDTHGLREFFDSNFANPETLFDGFFISDTAASDGSGPDVPEVKLTGGLSAAAEINLGIAKAGVAGGIFLEVNFDLHDPNHDGKIRLDELAKNFLNEAVYGSVALAPLAVFDVTGDIYAKLFAFLKVDLFLFSIDKEFDITPPITLVDFNIPFTRVPTLANELPGGTLQLNMGTNAGLRLEGDISDSSETFVVTQGSDANHVDVTAYGYTQSYSVSNKIIVYGGEGDDVIDLSGITNSAITYDIDGGAGNDTIILAQTAGAAMIKGGSGDDHITAGAGADVIYGGAGNDTIDAGDGNNLVFADDGKIGEDGLTLKASNFGGGADVVTGGAGDDVIFGGAGNDQLGGGDGNDVLIGDGGLITLGAPNAYLNIVSIEDTDSATGGNDTITGDLGNDLIYAGGGNDTVGGGEGDDEIWGGKGFDTITGDAGADTIHAGANDDTVTGGEGDDQIWGDEGKDLIHGNEGADQIWGGTGVDEIYGDAGNDIIFGESDPDKIYGGGGDDTIDGGAGNNLIYGDDKPGDNTGPEGNDHIVALNDSDEIHGQGGDDFIDAGNGNNVIFADYGTVTRDSAGRVVSGTSAVGAADGNDTVITGDGNQLVFLGAGNDNLTTGDGTSSVFADTSSITFGSGGAVLAASSTTSGSDGDDTIVMGDGSKLVFLGGGADHLTMGNGSATVFGDHGVLGTGSVAGPDDGADTILGGDGDMLLYAGAGDDTVTLGTGVHEIYGEAGDDTITLAGGDSYVEGNEGDDHITTGGGNDEIWAGSGDDVVVSGAGDDEIHGGAGVDHIWAGLGSDHAYGDEGNDWLYGGVGAAGTASETASTDTIDGGLGDDHIWGDWGDDDLAGAAGDDVVHGLAGNDYIHGNIGNDEIWGDAGDDLIVGGRGDDTIDGGAGDDLIWGGEEDYAASFFDRSNPANFTTPPGFDGAEALTPTGYVPPMITPAIANGLSIGSATDDNPTTIDDDPRTRDRAELGVFGDAFTLLQANLDVPIEDFNDVIQGGEGSDLIFGGGGRDALFGGGGSDYVDGGVERDEVYGEGGDDVVRGGANDDVVHGDYMYALGSSRADVLNPLYGDEGIDQLYGDEGSDFLFGDAGRNEGTAENPDWVQRGQRLWGGAGIDFLYAFANVGITADPADIAAEVLKWGDELHGGSGGDWLYGNLRRDVMFGDSGNEYIAGDYLAGPQLAQNEFANLIGGADIIHGGTGEDQLLGGGGDDELWGGGDSDWLEGQDGNDTLYGGTGIDIMVLDTRREYFAPDGVGVADTLPPIDQLTASQDTFDGGYGNDARADFADDNATDIMLIEGTNQRDTILIGQLADGRIHVDFRTTNPYTGAAEQWEILAPWRANVVPAFGGDYFDPAQPFDPNGTPLVEQFRVSGLMRDDDIEFVADPYQANAGTPAEVTVLPLDIGDLNARSNDFVGVIDGGPGDDLLVGTAGRDRIDGGSGSDTIYGLAGDDRLWGDSTAGEESVSTSDYDIIYGGRGDDDLIGGPGINDLYAWTQDPQPAGDPDFGVYVAEVLDPETGEMVPDPTGPVYDSMAPGRVLEDTGLDRMLGSRNADRLFGGTGLSFMFGNGGDDQMFRKDGSLFESLDGGLNGDDWKNFALESGRVWYVPGTEADDVITVDFVNEPGLLGDHHLVTRLTNNNGVYSFAASVNLDFNATDDSGNPLWDGADVLLNIQQLQQRGSEQDPSNPDPSIKTTNFTSTTLGLISGATLEGLLPQEGDFDVILIDALGGDDYISVGPTVQKTVWIDAGDGDDTVTISGGNVVLADRAEFYQQRNDTAANAYPLSPAPIDQSSSYTGLTIDSPDDVDWYRFSLAQDAADNAQFALDSASNLDGLQVALYEGLTLADAPGTRGTALALDNYGDTPLVTGRRSPTARRTGSASTSGAPARPTTSFRSSRTCCGTRPAATPPRRWTRPRTRTRASPTTGRCCSSSSRWWTRKATCCERAGRRLGPGRAVARRAGRGELLHARFRGADLDRLRDVPAPLAIGLAGAGLAAARTRPHRPRRQARHDRHRLRAARGAEPGTGDRPDDRQRERRRHVQDRPRPQGRQRRPDQPPQERARRPAAHRTAGCDRRRSDVGIHLRAAGAVAQPGGAGGRHLLPQGEHAEHAGALRPRVPGAALTTTESTLSNAANDSHGTALDLGAFSIFPQIVGTSIAGSGAEEWYQINLQRDGAASDVVRLSSSGPLQLQLVDAAGMDSARR